jgi:hypothetical protein
MEAGWHSLDLQQLLPETPLIFTGYLKVQTNGKFSIHKISRFSRSSGAQLHLSQPSLHPLAKPAARSAAGTLSISVAKLNDTLVSFDDASQDLGDIILTYPPRVLDVGAPLPYGAIQLFDGSQGQAEAQAELDTKWGPWTTVDGTNGDATGITFKVLPDPKDPGDNSMWTLQSCCHYPWGYDDLQANEAHGDVQIHVEFNMLGEYDDDNNPDPNADASQNNGSPGYTNSGVYVQSRYEVQIYSNDNRAGMLEDTHWMASLVDQKSPDSDQLRPNGEWQAYDITFRTSRWDGNNLLDSAYITVYWNGFKIHDNVLANGPATGGNSGEDHSLEIFGLKLQSEARDCRYRNVWMKHLTIEDPQTDFGY